MIPFCVFCGASFEIVLRATRMDHFVVWLEIKLTWLFCTCETMHVEMDREIAIDSSRHGETILSKIGVFDDDDDDKTDIDETPLASVLYSKRPLDVVN